MTVAQKRLIDAIVDYGAVNPGGWVAYPVPLDNGRWARLLLPSDITIADAKRIAKYIETLVLIP